MIFEGNIIMKVETVLLISLAFSSNTLYINNAEAVPSDLEYKIDKAKLHINSTVGFQIHLYTLSENCVKCPFSYITSVRADTPRAVYANTTHTTHLEVRRGDDGKQQSVVCKLKRDFGEHGVYYLFIFPNSTDDNIMCTCFYLLKPDNTNMPILIAFCIYVGLFLLLAVAQYLHRRHVFQRILHFIRTDRLVNADLGPPPPPRDSVDVGVVSAGGAASSKQQQRQEQDDSQPLHPAPTGASAGKDTARLTSLDTFRGLSIVVMIFVNYGAGRYWFFRHARWNGVHLADLVFPWFMFIMGTSIAIAFNKVVVIKGVAKWKVLIKVLKRTVWLFCLGLMVNSLGSRNSWQQLRIPGVLQRFAVCYLVVATIDLALIHSQPTAAAPCTHMLEAVRARRSRAYLVLRDVVSHWLGWLMMSFCVVTWLAVTFLLPVPGCPQGYLGPGGLHDNHSHPNCTGGAAGYVDRWFLTDTRIYHHPSCKETYQTTVPYDPEGILGTLTSIFLVYLGLQAGKIFVYHERAAARIPRLLIWGLLCCLIAGALCGFSRDDGVIPINKNLWSLSFVLCLGGMAYILLACLYYTIDVKHLWSGSPLYQPGMNSILLYVGSEVFHSVLPFNWQTRAAHGLLLVPHLFGTSLWVAIACYWHHINYYVSL